MVTAADLAAYVTGSATDPFIAACCTQAGELVAAYVGDAVIPAAVADRAALEVAAELFHRRQAPGGITQFATPDGGSAVRMARDPMVAAYPLLNRYLGLGLA